LFFTKQEGDRVFKKLICSLGMAATNICRSEKRGGRGRRRVEGGRDLSEKEGGV
jgi:hypothetical protein